MEKRYQRPMFFFIVFSLFIPILFLFSGCTEDHFKLDFSVADPAAVVSGQVINGETQDPVSGLEAELVVDGSPRVTLTDTKGRFVFGGVPVTSGAGHLLTITDKRTPAPTVVLATHQQRVGVAGVSAGENQANSVDLGIIALAPGASLTVLVTNPTSPVPAGVTVMAIPTAGNGSCSGFQVVVSLGGAGLNIHAQTSSSGVATLSGLNKCVSYTIVVPAQVIGGTQFTTGAAVVATLAGVQGENSVTVALAKSTPNEALINIASNMGLPGNAGAGSVALASRLNASNLLAAALPLGNPIPAGTPATFTAGTTGDLILVLNLPATSDGDINLTTTDDLRDPDANDNAALDAGFAGGLIVSGTTGSLDSTGTILTIKHTAALTANAIYNIQGTLRGPSAAVLPASTTNTLDLNTLSAIYVSDSGAVPSSTTISADNFNGSATSVVASPVFLVFNEYVTGTVRLISTATGPIATTVTTTFDSLANTPLIGGTGSIIFSDATDPTTVPPDAFGPCTVCKTGNGTFYRVALPGVTLADNIAATTNNKVTVFVDVIDMQGNKFAGELSLVVN